MATAFADRSADFRRSLGRLRRRRRDSDLLAHPRRRSARRNHGFGPGRRSYRSRQTLSAVRVVWRGLAPPGSGRQKPPRWLHRGVAAKSDGPLRRGRGRCVRIGLATRWRHAPIAVRAIGAAPEPRPTLADLSTRFIDTGQCLAAGLCKHRTGDENKHYRAKNFGAHCRHCVFSPSVVEKLASYEEVSDVVVTRSRVGKCDREHTPVRQEASFASRTSQP